MDKQQIHYCQPTFQSLARRSINILVLMLPHQKSLDLSHRTEELVTVHWLDCEALCKATADITAMPRATLGRTVHTVAREMMILLRGIQSLRPEETGDRLCSLCCPWGILVCCWCRSPVRWDSTSGRATTEMLCVPLVLLQGVCDAGGAFLDVYIANATFVHDTVVGLMSPF